MIHTQDTTWKFMKYDYWVFLSYTTNLPGYSSHDYNTVSSIILVSFGVLQVLILKEGSSQFTLKICLHFLF